MGDEKSGLLAAALDKQLVDGKAGRELNESEEQEATSFYDTNTARILKIKEDDTNYLNEELATIAVIDKILVSLGITDEVTTDVPVQPPSPPMDASLLRL